jgi:hypothetical protein
MRQEVFRYVETRSHLGTKGFRLPALQHNHPDLLLYREILRATVRAAFSMTIESIR